MSNSDKVQRLYNLIANDVSSPDAEKLAYEWVKTGVLSLGEFSEFMNDVRNLSREVGYQDGWEMGYETGTAE